MKQLLILLTVISLISCKKEKDSEKLKIDFNSFKVSEINENDTNIYKIIYTGEYITKIINIRKIDYSFRSQIYDSIMFYYSSDILDSAIRIKEKYFSNAGQYGYHGIGIDTLKIKFIAEKDKIIQKVGDVSGYVDIQSKLLITDYSYDANGRLNTMLPGTSLTYDKSNNVIQQCDKFDCYKIMDYDNNPNPYKSINYRLKYPYFDKSINLSDNNPKSYEDYILGVGKRITILTYTYDSNGKVIEINNKTKIKY